MRGILTLCATAAIAGCTSPSARIASELGQYGLDAQRAQCIGERLARDLSTDQLRELAGAARAYAANDANDSSPGRLTVSDFTRVAGSVRDPAVPIAVVRAGSACGVTIRDVLR